MLCAYWNKEWLEPAPVLFLFYIIKRLEILYAVKLKWKKTYFLKYCNLLIWKNVIFAIEWKNVNLLCRGASLFEKGNVFDILALYSTQFLYFCVVTLLNHFNLIFKRLWNRSNTPVITFISHNGRKYQAMYRYVPVLFFYLSLSVVSSNGYIYSNLARL